jgi:hypothetical protein
MVLVAKIMMIGNTFRCVERRLKGAIIMTTVECIISLFCVVDDALGTAPKHPQAKLYPSELVTIGLLCALKGTGFRAFYRWLARDYADLFGGLPERTRLLRLLRTHSSLTERFLAAPTFFTVIDTYGIELIHPIRRGRSPQQLGRAGQSNRRWIVGVKLCWLVNDRGQVVRWDWNSANVHDNSFRHVAQRYAGETITLADRGFRCQVDQPENLQICARDTWNERMLIETMFAMLTQVCHLKQLTHRAMRCVEMRLAYATAMFNVVLTLNRRLMPNASLEDRLLHIAQYSL